MDDKTAKAVKALGINAKNEEDAREQILEILKKNEIEGMEDEELSTLIDIAEALVGDSKEDSEEDENDKLAKEVEDEEDADEDENDDDESEEEENVEEGGDELDDMDRSELKTYIKEHELNVKVTKKMEDDDIREAIREAIHAAEAENGNDEDEQDDEPELEPEEKPAKAEKAEKKAAKKAEKKEEEPAEKSNKNADKKAEKAEKKADKKEKKEGGRKKTKIDPKNNNEDRKVFDVFKELFPEDNFNYNWVEGGVTIKHRGENSERGIVCMKPFYRKEDGLVGNMYIAALTKNTDVLDKNDIDYGFHWNDAPEMKNITIDEAYEILEKVQDVILEKVQKIDKKLGDNKAKMEKNLEKGAKKSDKKEEKEADVKADKKVEEKAPEKSEKKVNKKDKKK